MATFTPKKTSCPITRQEFAQSAGTMSITLGDQPTQAQPKAFSTGSFGWNSNAKLAVKVKLADGREVIVPCQVSLNITAIGSKELPENGSPERQTLTAKDVGAMPAGIAPSPAAVTA